MGDELDIHVAAMRAYGFHSNWGWKAPAGVDCNYRPPIKVYGRKSATKRQFYDAFRRRDMAVIRQIYQQKPMVVADMIRYCFSEACMVRWTAFARWAMTRGSTISTRQYMKAFISACLFGHSSIIEVLFDYVSHCQDDIRREFAYACLRGNVETAKTLHRLAGLSIRDRGYSRYFAERFQDRGSSDESQYLLRTLTYFVCASAILGEEFIKENDGNPPYFVFNRQLDLLGFEERYRDDDVVWDIRDTYRWMLNIREDGRDRENLEICYNCRLETFGNRNRTEPVLAILPGKTYRSDVTDPGMYIAPRPFVLGGIVTRSNVTQFVRSAIGEQRWTYRSRMVLWRAAARPSRRIRLLMR
jgi:hypothetical protein